LKIFSLKRKSIPKVAVLATALAVGFMAATVDMRPAQATPDQGLTCIGCHDAAGSVTATPSTATPVAGAAYTVAIVITNTATGNSGYNISIGGVSQTTGGPAGGKTFTADMTAPASAGTYVYTVGADTGRTHGAASTTTYSITVAAAPPTTVPPTTVPPTTAPPTTIPPTTVPPTVVPTVVPTTIPPVVAPVVVPVGAPATGAGGAAQSNGSPLMGFGGLALLLSGAAMVTAIRRRRQV